MNTKATIMPSALTWQMVLFISFIALSVYAPIISHHYQPLSGTIVNTILFLTVMMLGLKPALLISFLPSPIAYATGLLPKPFLPLIPVIIRNIILGNIILVAIFHRLYPKSYFIGSVSAAIIKFMVIFSATALIAGLILPAPLLAKVLAMFGWMQLATAIAGGLVAYSIIKLTKTDIYN